MAEIRIATEDEIAGFNFPEFGKNTVATVWNAEENVALAKYHSNGVFVQNILDYRDTEPDFFRKLANDQAKIKSNKFASEFIEAGNTTLYIPVERDVLEPGRAGGSERSISFNRYLTLLRKKRNGKATEEELALIDANRDKLEEAIGLQD